MTTGDAAEADSEKRDTAEPAVASPRSHPEGVALGQEDRSTPPAGAPNGSPQPGLHLGHAHAPGLNGTAPGLDAGGPPGAGRPPVVADVPIGAVPVEIGLRSLGGSSRFEIRLTPEDLGRIDVRIEIDGEKHVQAHLAVERPDTLALLSRDRAQLERVFEQAGLRTSDGGVAFSLRDGSGGGGQTGSGQPGWTAPAVPPPAADDDLAASASVMPAVAATSGPARSAGVDLRI